MVKQQAVLLTVYAPNVLPGGDPTTAPTLFWDSAQMDANEVVYLAFNEAGSFKSGGMYAGLSSQ